MKSYFFLFLIIFISCVDKVEKKRDKLFSMIPSEQSGIDFTNELVITEDLDVFRFRNYYNGGGVAIGDLNNDSLPEVYFTSNMNENRLYLNKGDFKFRDITESSMVAGEKAWSTGVSMADVNGDGLLDIYVCNSGDIKGGKRENELFINNGDLTFSEKAQEFGLDDKGFSTHAVFFDYDQDGDLDCYMLNNSFRPVSSLGLENIRHLRDSTGGDKLYRNDDSRFVDVSAKSGIYGSVIGFGLGVTVTDVNDDNWMDIYVSNDFFERDYLYINQGDGTFKDELPERMGHISRFSMGADAADINNDGLPEIFVTDMLPDNDLRLKRMTNFETYDYHQLKLSNDYYEQYMRNTLQLNNGSNFIEIGQYANVHATDWSWGALISDFDNDSKKEIFVSNGVFKDVTDQDFIDFLANDETLLTAMRQESIDFGQLVKKMPSNKLSNYLFKNDEGLKYKNISSAWGLDEPSFSNGAAYGDLDNDGDLDLVVNNVNQEVFIYRNNTSGKSYLKVAFKGPGGNRFGIGAKIEIYVNGHTIMQENVPIRGFQSSMDYKMVVGLDTVDHIDSLVVSWGYGKSQKLSNIALNQTIELNIEDAVAVRQIPDEVTQIFSLSKTKLQPEYKHEENLFVDFDRERLIYHMISREGPALCIGDINGDALDDFFIGGALGYPGRIYLQNKKGNFENLPIDALLGDKYHEDVDAVFFDADGDKDLDLYVVSGGYELRENARELEDRLYIQVGLQNGKPRYEKSEGLPAIREVGACVEIADYDNDGDIDLFVGGRAVPGKYGMAANSHIFQNNGQAQFIDVTNRIAPRLFNLGMVTDATWSDYDNDEDLDLIIVGEWMPIVLFKNNGTNYERLNNVPGLIRSEGWWTSIESTDINLDGNPDYIVGNWGLNTKFKATTEHPITLFISDFDNNRTLDHVYAYYEGDSLYPMALKRDMVNQLNYLKKRFVYHKDYAGKTINQIFTQDQLKSAFVNHAHTLHSSVVINHGDGSYTLRPLPEMAQLSPIITTLSDDFDGDGSKDLLLAGNYSSTKPEEGRHDANNGLLMNLSNVWRLIPNSETGLKIDGDAKATASIRTINNKKMLIVAKNNNSLEFYEY